MVMYNTSKKMRFVLKVFLLIACFAIASIHGVTISIFLKLLGKSNLVHVYTGTCFAWVVSLALGIKYKVVNEEVFKEYTKKPFVLITNHQSLLDVVPMGRIIPLIVLWWQKDSCFLHPFWAFIVYIQFDVVAFSDVIFINSPNKKSTIQTTETFALEMIKRQVLHVNII